jgi:hypothetical protein
MLAMHTRDVARCSAVFCAIYIYVMFLSCRVMPCQGLQREQEARQASHEARLQELRAELAARPASQPPPLPPADTDIDGGTDTDGGAESSAGETLLSLQVG